MAFHQLDIDKVLEQMETSKEGLSAQAVVEKKKRFGPNQSREKKQQPAWVLFIKQFQDTMILILLSAAVISGIIGEIIDTVIIFVIILLNAVIGFAQEYRAEKVVAALKQMATPEARVIRDGHSEQILSTDLVPGDLVLLEAGNVIPADLRLMESFSLRVEESSLTGESNAVHKTTAAIAEENIPPGDKLNMAFKGTRVVHGRGTGIVVATGMDTELGKIAGLLHEKEARTPLQQRMADFGKKLSYIVIVICAVLFGLGILRGEKPVDMLLVAISLAVAAIPEALPALITISLARGAQRMVKKNALIRKLPAVETLGSVNFICSDKTGTLTENKMTVAQVLTNDGVKPWLDKLPALETAMALCHDVRSTNDGKRTGDPTEIALVDYVEAQYSHDILEQAQARLPREAEIPFDSDRKCMTTIHKADNSYVAITKGAAEVILSKLADQSGNENILVQMKDMASRGNRVLAFAARQFAELPGIEEPEQVERELDYLGLVGLIDPPREEAKKAIQECKTAGICPVMITGDHIETATAIARELDMLPENNIVISGSEMSEMLAKDLEHNIERISVYARVSPEQKLTIVKTLQSKKHYVAMTGDGVNDAPSLKMQI